MAPPAARVGLAAPETVVVPLLPAQEDAPALPAGAPLVLSGHLLGSPRCRALFGWPEVPLQEAGLQRADPLLDRAIAALDGLACLSRHNLLMVVPAQASAPWRELPFRLLEFNADAERLWGFSRLSIQPLDDERCAVVAHASPAIAAEALPLATALRRTLQEVCGPGIPVEGAMEVMRWGAALPLAPGLDPGLCLCRRSRIGFCGDYVAGEGFGRLEGALLSAERLAAELVAVMGGGSER